MTGFYALIPRNAAQSYFQTSYVVSERLLNIIQHYTMGNMKSSVGIN